MATDTGAKIACHSFFSNDIVIFNNIRDSFVPIQNRLSDELSTTLAAVPTSYDGQKKVVLKPLTKWIVSLPSTDFQAALQNFSHNSLSVHGTTHANSVLLENHVAAAPIGTSSIPFIIYKYITEETHHQSLNFSDIVVSPAITDFSVVELSMEKITAAYVLFDRHLYETTLSIEMDEHLVMLNDVDDELFVCVESLNENVQIKRVIPTNPGNNTQNDLIFPITNKSSTFTITLQTNEITKDDTPQSVDVIIRVVPRKSSPSVLNCLIQSKILSNFISVRRKADITNVAVRTIHGQNVDLSDGHWRNMFMRVGDSLEMTFDCNLPLLIDPLVRIECFRKIIPEQPEQDPEFEEEQELQNEEDFEEIIILSINVPKTEVIQIIEANEVVYKWKYVFILDENLPEDDFGIRMLLENNPSNFEYFVQ